MIYTFLEYGILVIVAISSSIGTYLFFKPIWSRWAKSIEKDKRHARAIKEHKFEALYGISDAAKQEERQKGLVRRVWEFIHLELELMLRSTMRSYRETTVQTYVILNLAILFGIGTVSFLITTAVRFSLVIAIGAVVCIYGYYRLKLRKLRLKGGYELATVTGIIASKYKFSRGKMRVALQLSVPEIQSVEIRDHILNILREEQLYEHPDQLKKKVLEFTYSIDTSFADELGDAMLKGLLTGENVEYTLMNIDRKIQRNLEMLADEGDNKGEILSMSWLHVILFPISIFFSVLQMGFTAMIEMQFQTGNGRFIFFLTTLFIILSVFLGSWFRRPPNDY